MKSSSKLEVSASEVRMGTKGAFIDFVTKAFQFTFSNQGWFLTSSDPLAPSLSFGFFSSNRASIFCSLGEAWVRNWLRWGSGEAGTEWTRRATSYSGCGREGTLSPSHRLCSPDTTSPPPYCVPASLSLPELGTLGSRRWTWPSRPRR